MTFIIIILFLFIPNKIAAQIIPFQMLREEGMCKGAIVNLSLDQGGYVWVTTRDKTSMSCVCVIDREHNIFNLTSENSGISEKSHQIVFEQLDEKDFSDPTKGNIWFATDEGIRRLDRQGNWYIYNSKNSRLPGNEVTAFALSRQGDRWIAIANQGINLWSKGGTWKVFTRKGGLCSDTITSILIDSRGNVWCGSKGYGISRLNTDGKWQNFLDSDSGLIDNTINSISEDGEGKIWIATNKGISVFDENKWMSYTPFNSPLPEIPITAIALDKEGNRWIGTWGKGVYLLKKNGNWSTYTNLKDNYVTALLIDCEENLWVGTNSGLLLLPGKSTSKILKKSFCERLWDFGPPAIISQSEPDEGFEWGIIWNSKENEIGRKILNFALFSSISQEISWSYAFLSLEETGSPFKDLSYKIKVDNLGNQWIETEGFFNSVSFYSFLMVRVVNKTISDIKKKPYPFPRIFPEEVRVYLRSTPFLPGDDPELHELAQSLVSETSAGDMYLTVKELVFSPLFRDCAFDYGDCESNYSFLNGRSLLRSPKEIREKNKGVSYSKARMLATLARSLNIPSRLIMTADKRVWCETWINGLGWVATCITFPIYDYVWSERIVFPRINISSELPVLILSGEDGELKLIDWSPEVEASIKVGSEKDLLISEEGKSRKLLILKPSTLKEIPLKKKIPFAQGVSTLPLEEGGKVFFLIFDEKGVEKKRLELKESNDLLNIEIDGKVLSIYKIKKIGNFFLLLLPP